MGEMSAVHFEADGSVLMVFTVHATTCWHWQLQQQIEALLQGLQFL
jgi:hypothetical protein